VSGIVIWSNGQLEGERSNLGDRSIFSSMLESIRRVAHEPVIAVLSTTPDNTGSRYAVHAANVFGVRGLLAVLSATASTDLLLLGGGELVQDKSSRLYLLFNLLPALFARCFGRKVMCYAIGVADLSEISRLGRLLARFTLNRVHVITTRDRDSLENLRKLHVTKPLMRQTADASLMLQPADDEHVKMALSEEGVCLSQEGLIVISVRNVFNRTRGLLPASIRRRLRIPVPRRIQEQTRQFQSTIARLADALIDRHNVSVLFLPAYNGTGFSLNDRTFSGEIVGMMQNRARAKVLQGEHDPRTIIGIIGRADMLIGTPLHSLILALIANTPMVALGYASKVRYFMSQIDRQAALLDITALPSENQHEHWLGIIEQTWQNRDALKHQLQPKLETLRTMSKLNETSMAELLNGRPRPR
jgi:polysaccharide pyruvyl transferase WcaK-like protein